MPKRNIFSDSKKKKATQLLESNQLTEARNLLNKLASNKSRDPEVWFLLSAIHGMQDNPQQAEYCAEKAIELAPAFPEAYFNLANAQRDLGKTDKALANFEQTLKLSDNHVGALVNAAGLYLNQEKLVFAEQYFLRALNLAPNHPAIYYNLGKLCHAQGKYTAAIDYYKHTIALKSDHLDAYNNLSRLYLMLGQFKEGWQYYRFRVSQQTADAISPPTSLPDDLSAKHLLLQHDQGIGDEIFFLRFISHLKIRGAWVAYHPRNKIRSLLSRVTDIDYLTTDTEEIPNVDYTFSVGDLPLLLGIDETSQIPPPLKLTVRPDLVKLVHEELTKAGPPPYLALTWRAGTPEKLLLYKEIPKTTVADLVRDVNATFISLQRNPQPGEIEKLGNLIGKQVHDFDAYNDELEKMLCLLSLIDRYACVSNTNVHLLAGLGKTCDVFVPFPPEWRWMAEGNESPWFPSFRIYRQSADGSWQQALNELKTNLEQQLS